MSTEVEEARARVLNYVESTFEEILQCIGNRSLKRPSIHLKRIRTVTPQEDPVTGDVGWEVEEYDVTYAFPGKTKSETWRFACVLKVLDEIHAALSRNVVVSKRDIFYRDPGLFSKQEIVDRLIDDVGYTCGVQRSDMNVQASPKGLVMGLDMSSNEIELIPSSTRDLQLEDIRWILVVEKEASFKTLSEQWSHLTNCMGRGLLVTAKGYPDLATRDFLGATLQHASSFISVYGLFDFDPYGVDILKCYRYGSKASTSAPLMVVPQMKWLGIKSRHLIDKEMDDVSCELTEADRIRARNMLSMFKGNALSYRTVPGLNECVEELERMLMLNQKAEIQMMDSGRRRFAAWVVDEVLQTPS